ncbi:Insulinase (Peptidase M16) [Terramyces sp. JEL0728]|nr:Insulinase (Peptidase M16) [Terramyces sp. JEL0728]
MANTANYTVLETDILKPDNDDREYQAIMLENELDVLLISDPHADKSSAAMDVHVGHLSDPDDTAGLAHFCEHLLFMGTEKYPEENEYRKFLAEHGGHSNAFTSGDHTNYYFEISSDYLEGALDRFSSFFKCPLFLDSCKEREMLAVDSGLRMLILEHKKNIQSDTWRGYQLLKDLSSPTHPFRKFGTGIAVLIEGNLETLRDIPSRKGLDVRKVLLDFHEMYYSSNIMKLVILGKESIPELTELAIKMFSGIKNKKIEPPTFGVHPYTRNELMKLIKIKPVKERRNLTLLFPCRDHKEHYETHPLQYVSHLIGHEGPGSILSLLKAKGWAHGLTAGVSGYGASEFEFFRISIDVTPSGEVNFEQVLCQAINEIAFRFKEKTSPSAFSSKLSGNLHVYPPKNVISGQYLCNIYDADIINECFSYFKLENLLLFMESTAFQADDWMEANWYGTNFTIEDFGQDLISKISTAARNSQLEFPEKNSFIPENFQVIGKSDTSKPLVHPWIISESPKMRLWHKKDDRFFTPKANLFFEIRTPLGYESARSFMLTRLFVELVKDSLIEYSYFAEVAGLTYNIDNSTDGLILTIYGYNDKLSILLKKIIEKIVSLSANEDHFARIKDSLYKKTVNWFQESPHSHAMYFISFVTQEKIFSNEEKLNELQTITLEAVIEFSKHLVGATYVEGLVHGNVSQEDALELGNIVLNGFSSKKLPNRDATAIRIHKLDLACHVIFSKDVYSADNLNSAIEYCIQVGPVSDSKLRNLLNLLSQIGQEIAFDQLRTKEQLGYMVYSGVRKQSEMISYRVIIQSERDPMFLEGRIESFLQMFRTVLQQLSQSEFEKHKSALIAKLTEKLKNLQQESSRLWSNITSQYYDFEQNESDALTVGSFAKAELIEFFDTYLSAENLNRRKISVHMRSQRIPVMIDHDFKIKSRIIKDDEVMQFKAQMELTNLPKPIHSISTWII